MIWTDHKAILAIDEAERWRGVPHMNNMAKFPVGIDCIHYVAEILFAAEIMERRELPRYNPNIGLAKPSDLIEIEILRQLHTIGLEVSDGPVFGDVVTFKTGSRSVHCGFFAGKNLYHSLAHQCVVRSEWQHWRHRAKLLIRFQQTGWKA